MTQLTDLRAELQRAIVSCQLALAKLELLIAAEKATPPNLDNLPRGSTFSELVPELPKKFNPADWQKSVLVKPQLEVVKASEPVVNEPLIETEEWKSTLNVLNTGDSPVF